MAGMGGRRDRLNVLWIKTFYPHWGQRTAFNSLGPYLDPAQVRLAIKDVPMGEEDFLLPFIKDRCRRAIRARGAAAYRLNDLAAELAAFGRALFPGLDIIHFLDAEHGLLFLPQWLKKWRQIKRFPRIIAMFHQPPEILDRFVNRETLGLVDAVLLVSPTQEEYFARFLPRERIHTILLGVDSGHFKPLGRPKEPGKLKCLAGGVWLRDYRALEETARLVQGRARIEFHLVAPRFDIPAGLDNITWHERIPDDELFDLYQTCDLLFLPLQNATANTFLLEGAACGLPVISSELAAIKTYFPGPEALLVKDNRPEAFARILLDLAADKDRLGLMGRAAAKQAAALSWSHIAPQYLALYRRLAR